MCFPPSTHTHKEAFVCRKLLCNAKALYLCAYAIRLVKQKPAVINHNIPDDTVCHCVTSAPREDETIWRRLHFLVRSYSLRLLCHSHKRDLL